MDAESSGSAKWLHQPDEVTEKERAEQTWSQMTISQTTS